MIKNLKKEIIRSFLFHRKYIVWLALTCLFSSFVFSAYCTVQETNTYNQISEIKSDYGTYTYKLCDLEKDEIQTIKNDDSIASYLMVQTKYIEFMDGIFTYMAVSEEFFEYSNYSILEGRYPKSKDEVMVPKWYLHQLGISPDAMVGSKIEITNPNTGKLENKEVSGLVVITDDNRTGAGSDNSNFFLFGEDFVNFEDSLHTAYIISKNLEQYEKNINSLLKTINDDGVDYQVNYALLDTCGYTEQGKIQMLHQKALYLGIIFLILFLVSILMSNILTVCLEKWKPTLGVYKIIGANMMQIKNNMQVLFVIAICISTILGAFLGIGSMCLYTHIYSLHMQVSVVWPALEGILVLLLFVRMLAKRLEDYDDKTAQEVITERKIRLDDFLNKKSLFKKQHFCIIKLSFRNFIVYGKKKMISITSIVACVILLFTICIQFQEETIKTDSNEEYKYYIEVEDYFNVKINASEKEIEGIINTCKQIEKLCTQSGYTVYYDNGYVHEFKLPKSKLSKEYIAKLNRTVSGQVGLSDARNYITEDAVIMGYSQKMIRELAKEQNLNIEKLEADEAIILSRNTNKDGKGGSHILSMSGECFDIDTFVRNQEHSRIANTYTIVANFNELSVYPNYDKNAICIIIDINQYNKYFNKDFVSSFYLKDIDGTLLSKIQSILQGNSYVKLINQQDEALAEKEGYQKRMLLMALVLAMCCFFTVINIQVQNIFEFDYRKSEFDLLNIIGMSQRKKYIMISLETAYIFLLGLLIGFAICRLIQKLLYQFCIINSQYTGVDFVVSSVLVVFIFMLSSIVLTCRKMK